MSVTINISGNVESLVVNSGEGTEIIANGDTVWEEGPDTRTRGVIRTTAANETVTFYMTQSAANAVTIKWGDGTADTNPTDTTITAEHTYAVAGDHEFIIEVAEGETATLGQSATQGFLKTGGVQTDDRLISIIVGDGTSCYAQALASEVSLTSARFIYPSCFYAPGVAVVSASILKSCTALTDCVIAEGTSEIPGQFVRGCSALKTLTLPSTIASISAMPFRDSGLTSLVCLPAAPPVAASSTFTNIPDGMIVYVPAASVATYKAAEYWSTIADRIQAIV